MRKPPASSLRPHVSLLPPFPLPSASLLPPPSSLRLLPLPPPVACASPCEAPSLILSQGVGEAFREDIQSLGLAFTEILFPRMAQAGTDFRRVIVDMWVPDPPPPLPWGAQTDRGGSGEESVGGRRGRGAHNTVGVGNLGEGIGWGLGSRPEGGDAAELCRGWRERGER